MLCGFSAMAYSVFLLLGQLSQMSYISGNAKHRIKTKATAAPAVKANRTFACTFEHMLLATRRNKHDKGTKASRAPSFRHVRQVAKQRRAPVAGRSALVIACGANPRGAAQCIHLKP